MKTQKALDNTVGQLLNKVQLFFPKLLRSPYKPILQQGNY